MNYADFAKPDPDFVRLNSIRDEASWHADRSRGVSMVALGAGVLLLMASDTFGPGIERAMGLLSVAAMAFGSYHAFLVHGAVRDKAIVVLAATCICMNAWISLIAYGPGAAFGRSIAVMMTLAFLILSFGLGMLGMTLFRRQKDALARAAKDALRAFERDEDR